MGNEESKIVAGIVIARRAQAIASFDIKALENRLAKMRGHERPHY